MPPADPARASLPAPGVPVSAPALEGDLSIFPTTDLFQFFALLGLSGTLVLEREGSHGQERVSLRLRGGRLIEARTSGPRAYLGELLVRRYGVPMEAVLDGLRRQTAARRLGQPASRLGELLLERQLLAREVLRQALDESVSRVAGPVLLWCSGSFAFHADPSPMVPPALAGRVAEPEPSSTDPGGPEVSLEELVLRRWGAGEGGA